MRFCRGTAGLKPPDGRARLCGITTRHSSHACACQCHVSSRHSVLSRQRAPRAASRRTPRSARYGTVYVAGECYVTPRDLAIHFTGTG